MEIINKLKDYNSFVVGSWISARISHLGTVILFYKMPGVDERVVFVFDEIEDFMESNPVEILKECGFVRVIDRM